MKSLLCWGKGEGERHTRGEVHFSPVQKHGWRQESRPFRRVRLLTNLWKPQLQPNPQVPQTRAGTSLGPAERTALCVSFVSWSSDACLGFSHHFVDSPLPKLRLTHPDLRPSPGLRVSGEAIGRGVSREARLGTPHPKGPFQRPPESVEKTELYLKKKKILFGQEATVVMEWPGTLGMGGGPISPFPFR